jgi:hypothetical protein
VKQRNIDKYHGFEEDMLHSSVVPNIAEIQSLPGSEQDKTRLLAIAYLTKSLGLPEIQGLDMGVDLRAIEYLDRRRRLIGENKQGEVSALSYLTNKVKGMIGGDRLCEVTKLLHSVLENKAKNLLYLDSKFQGATAYKREFTNIVVFVIGGGSYTEYHNVQAYAKKLKKSIIYGCTTLSAPNKFLEQLSNLA